MASVDTISWVANWLEIFPLKGEGGGGGGNKWCSQCLLECMDLVCTNNFSSRLLKVILGIQKPKPSMLLE